MSYFSIRELACQHCGKYRFDPEFLATLNSIRKSLGFPLVVGSGYRCLEHPIEAAKTTAGAHSSGMAVDISVRGERAYKLIQAALEHKVPRIGVNQKGSNRFIHLDGDTSKPSPVFWSY